MKDLLVKAAIALAAVFSPIQATILTVFFLCFADAVTGIMAARKRGEPIKSAALRRTISKLFIYEAVIMLSYATEIYLLGGVIPACKLVASAIALVEFKSLLENCETVLERNLFADLIAMLGSKNDTQQK
jgi:hypothetical protein